MHNRLPAFLILGLSLAAVSAFAAPAATSSPATTSPKDAAQAPAAAPVTGDDPDPANVDDRLARALELLDRQQQQLDEQAEGLAAATKLITRQGERIDRLETLADQIQGSLASATSNVETVRPPAQGTPPTPAHETDGKAPTVAAEPAKTVPAAASAKTQAAAAAAESAAKESEGAAIAAAAQVDVKAVEDDPTRAIMESLPGAIRLPGTDVVMRWGGFVKTAVVNSFEPLQSTDRFITGLIPVDNNQDIVQQATITASQSRLNVDMREPTNVGLLRAFIEGDFAGNGDTFRLRHAFGQRGDVLAGKTWSNFVDTTATPEEVDFEGLNGRINVRQGQVRVQPKFGRRYEMAISLEDPDPQVTNGTGISQTPDFVVSGRVNWGDHTHLRIATVLRQVRAQDDADPARTLTEFGWGTSVSGRIDTPMFDDRDALLFQFNFGTGYGRYVNDLNSTGNFDGFITPTGELKLIDVYAGYLAAQHWWSSAFRSNLILGFVRLDNPSEVPEDFYKRTWRVSGNLFWSPTPRFNVGAELLWGRRENKDGQAGDASQLQIGAKYLF